MCLDEFGEDVGIIAETVLGLWLGGVAALAIASLDDEIPAGSVELVRVQQPAPLNQIRGGSHGQRLTDWASDGGNSHSRR